MSTRADTQELPERLIDSESERLVLANILSVAGFFRSFCVELTDDDFAVEPHRRVFALAREVRATGADPTLSACYHRVLEAGKAIDEMGLPQLSPLAMDGFVELADPAAWVRTLKRKAAERRAWRVAERLRLGIESGLDTTAELAAAMEELRTINGSMNAPAKAAVTIADAVHAIGVDNLLSAPKGTIASPWGTLNGLINDGPRSGELWTIGARPSVGKSTVCLQWAMSAAKAGHRVVLLSLEMPTQDLLKRALSAEGDIPHGLLVRGDLERSWRFRVAETLDRIGEYRLELSDQVRTLPGIIGKIAATAGIGVLVVDYLGLVDPGRRVENRNQEVSAISRGLKLAALDYGIPIIAAHQLNRANDSENRPPRLSDLRDSGSVEQDSDAVLVLDAPGSRGRGDTDRDAVDVIIAKQRNGVSGHKVALRLEGKFCRLVEPGSSREAREVA